MMIEVVFKYKDKEFIINYDTPRKLKEICEEFAKNQSLDMNDIFFTYEYEKVNLNTELYLEQQFNLKNKTRIEFSVIRETPFQIIFFFSGKTMILKVEETEKMKDIFKRFTKKARIDLTKIYFLYNSKQYDYENIGEITVREIIGNDNDRLEKLLSIPVKGLRNDTINSIKSVQEMKNLLIDNDNNSDKLIDEKAEDILLQIEENMETPYIKIKNKFKWFYFINFIILFSQLVCIIILTSIAFHFEFNEIIIKADVSLVIKYIPILVFILLLMFIFRTCLFDYKLGKITFIFHIIFPLFICYCSFLLSEYLDSKYIIIGISLIGMEILSILINIFTKKFEILYIGLSAVILSLIGLIFFSAFWIKSLYPIIFVSIFWLVSNGCYAFLIFVTKKLCKSDEYIYSVMIFNYSIFLGLAYIIVESTKYIKKSSFNNDNVNVNYNDNVNINDNEPQGIKKFYLMNFLILFIQFSLIITIIIIGFIYKFNEILMKFNISLAVKYTPLICLMFSLAIILKLCLFYDKKNQGLFCIFFPPFICYYCFFLSEYIDPKYFIIGLSLVGIEISSLLINIILNKFERLYICLSAVILSLIGLIFFSAFWIKSLYPIIYVSIFWLISIGLYTLFIFVTKELCKSDEYIYSVIIFNYNIFFAISSLIIQIIKCIYYNICFGWICF